MCEHTFPSHAVQVQWAHTIVPLVSAAIQGFRELAYSFCECFTLALIRQVFLARPADVTSILLIHPETK